MLARDEQIFAVDKEDTRIGGVHAYVYTPKSGISEVNKQRVLINLHGADFPDAGPDVLSLNRYQSPR